MPVSHGEEGEETARKSDTASTGDGQSAFETENCPQKLATALVRSNKFKRRAEEDGMDSQRVAAQKLQNQNLTGETDELIMVGNEFTGHRDVLTKEKNDLIREREALIRESKDLIGEREYFRTGKDESTKRNDKREKGIGRKT
jgi:hypothetical protein